MQIRAFDPVPREELLKRIEGLKRLMANSNIDFGIVFQNVDKFYFTGTAQKGVPAVPPDGEPLFFIEKSIERARMESPLHIVPIKSDKEIHATPIARGFPAA